MLMPSQITAADDADHWNLHLYASGKASFPAKFTGWELDVIQAELKKPSLVGWYRNPTGGLAALAVPYTQSGVARTIYPDFLFFHEIDGEIVIDLIDPHRPDASDAGPKWTGLAAYAVAHGSTFRRIAAVIESTDKKLLSIDLKNPSIGAAVAQATNETDVRKLFADFGGAY